jgi:large subunit ribosomal protein L15
MQLHELQRAHARTSARRIGRGGKRGKMSGRGHKGQTARAGGRPRPEMRDIIKRLPKRRGFGKNRSHTVNASRTRAVPVNVSVLGTLFAPQAVVSPKTLRERKIISARGGRLPPVKILATGTLNKPLSVEGCLVSAAARAKIEAAGGSVSA